MVVLPNAEDHPTTCPVRGVSLAVTHPVIARFISPKTLPCLRSSPMIYTGVPKAPINKNRDSGRGENHVGRITDSDRFCVNSITQTARVHKPSERKFWSRIAPNVSAHDSGTSFGHSFASGVLGHLYCSRTSRSGSALTAAWARIGGTALPIQRRKSVTFGTLPPGAKSNQSGIA